ncbi:MAG: helix-turn-helix domain-containing protein [Pseudomonadota bacterium]
MVAVRRFDEDEAVQRLMEAFWRNGFRATSLDDLVTATGLKRGSLYAAFGDKEAMFLRAWQCYVERYDGPLLAMLDDPDVVAAVRALFRRMGQLAADAATPPGCLIANVASEAAGRGDAIEAAAREAFARAETAFYGRFLEAQAVGALAPGIDLRALARFFAAIMRSVPVVQRLTGDSGIVADVVTVALERLAHDVRQPAVLPAEASR